MKSIMTTVVSVLCLLALPCLAVAGAPAVGERFPDLALSAPANAAHNAELGVSGKETFRIGQTAGQVLIIEIFSMYCPFCQKEAPQVNRLYKAIQSRSDTAGKVKLIGIGAGNSPMEVDLFRETYSVLFPLFSDGDLSIHKLVGEVRTPYFFAMKRLPDGAMEVIFSKLGGIADVDQFLDGIARDAGIGK
ncbi:MAG: TlpA disulfide reductase family protein [Pseudomonadota bacterium]